MGRQRSSRWCGMRRLILSVTFLFMVVFVACGTEKWNRTYVGGVTASSEIFVLREEALPLEYVGSHSYTAETVTLTQEESGAVLFERDGCLLQLGELTEDGRVYVTGSQLCEIDINGYVGEALFGGVVYFDEEGVLRAELTAVPTDPSATGSYTYTFVAEESS